MAFTSCGNVLDWTDRPELPRLARNATGDPIITDGRMVVVEMNDCEAPRLSTETLDAAPVPEHGDMLHRFARREVLSARNGLLRANPVWRTYEGSRLIIEWIHRAQAPFFRSAVIEQLAGPFWIFPILARGGRPNAMTMAI